MPVNFTQVVSVFRPISLLILFIFLQVAAREPHHRPSFPGYVYLIPPRQPLLAEARGPAAAITIPGASWPEIMPRVLGGFSPHQVVIDGDS